MVVSEAVILAAGAGTRMKRGQTATSFLNTPKPLLKVGGVPIIERIVRKLSDNGLRVIVVINPIDDEKFRLALDKYGVVFCYQLERLGTAHALYSARDHINGNLFMVLMGDDLTEFDLDSAVKLDKPAVFGYEVEDLASYGAIVLDGKGYVREIREKAVKGRGIANTGLYVMPKDFFRYFHNIPKNEKSGEYYLTEAVRLLYDQGNGMKFRPMEMWKGINEPRDLIEASKSFTPEITLRKVKESDLENILQVLYQLSPLDGAEPASSSELSDTLKNIILNEDYYFLVAEIGNRIVGTATLLIQRNLTHRGRPYAHVENVVTDQEFRGKYIGAALITKLMEYANGRNCYKIILNCSLDNSKFYERCGFKTTGEIEMRFNSR